MCRFVAYLGRNAVLLEDILVKPTNSIVMQSLHARESSVPTNGDGFGLGWYDFNMDDTPGIFKSIYPAWNDNNLLHLASKIMSTCFMAHVRAASEGGVTYYNCHPFYYKNWMLVHNGTLQDFVVIKRHLRRILDDDLYHWIKGETDSEHVFALFMQIAKKHPLNSIEDAAIVLTKTLQTLGELVNSYGSKNDTSYFNLCLTNGREILASRYCSTPKIIPESLHFSVGSQFIVKNGKYHMWPLSKDQKPGSILVSSEKLTNFNAEWHDVPSNHLISIDMNLNVKLMPISISW